MSKIEDQFSKHRPGESLYQDHLSEDLRQLYLEGSWDTDENQAIRSLKSRLTDYQLKTFDFIEWLFYGPRATGRTYLLVTLAICKALEMPNQWINIQDHFAYPLVPGGYTYVEDMLWDRIKEIPIKANFEIRHNGGFIFLRYNKEKK